MHPYALVHGLAISASVLYLSFPERAVAHSSLFPTAALKSYFVFSDAEKNVLRKGAREIWYFFGKFLMFWCAVVLWPPLTPQAHRVVCY